MTKSPRLTPRKAPTQERSRATVDAILIATERCLVQDGFEEMNTNQVAEVAGFSVGSLYQYFPSKESLVTWLLVEIRREMVGALADVLMERPDAPIEDVARAYGDAVVGAYRQRLEVMQILLAVAPRIGAGRKLVEVETQAVDLVRGYLEMRKDSLRPLESPDRTAYVLVRAVEGAVRAAVLERPEDLEEETFNAEIAALITGLVCVR